MAQLSIDENKQDMDEDNISKRLNKAFESRLDLDRVCVEHVIVIKFDSFQDVESIF